MCVKKIFMMLTLAMLVQFGWGQEVSYQLSSHILDINKGAPAADVKIRLSKLETKTDTWIQVAEKTTDINGRVKDFLPEDGTNHQGIYKLTYETAHNSKILFILLSKWCSRSRMISIIMYR